MYTCPGTIYPPGWEDGVQHSCWNSSYAAPPSNCFMSIFYMWSANQAAFDTYPAGYPFGSSVDISLVMLESHMYNPNPQDSFELAPWGIRIYYTSTLRQVEGQVLGLFVGIDACPPTRDRVCGVLPGYEEYQLVSECPQVCLSGAMNSDGFVVQGIAPHAHSLGRKTRMSVVRNGVELPPFHFQDAWDYQIQGMYMIHPNHTNNRVLPGDRIMTTYTWNTTSRLDPIYWGETFDDEMANEWIYIYPRLTNGLTICKEQPGRRTDVPGHDIGVNFNAQCIGSNASLFGRIDLTPYIPHVSVSECPRRQGPVLA